MTISEIKAKQISDSLLCGMILSMAGGCMDAYSYLFRDHVFANAQTGNILLFGVNLVKGDIQGALKYLLPVAAFAAGIAAADWIHYKVKEKKLRWHQIAAILEAVILAAVAFIPTELNGIANALTSLGCGMQLETFRRISGSHIPTTMCIGNLRTSVNYLDLYLATGDKHQLQKAGLYALIIVAFMAGAVIESILIPILGSYAILLCSLILIIAFVLLFTSGTDMKADEGEA